MEDKLLAEDSWIRVLYFGNLPDFSLDFYFSYASKRMCIPPNMFFPMLFEILTNSHFSYVGVSRGSPVVTMGFNTKSWYVMVIHDDWMRMVPHDDCRKPPISVTSIDLQLTSVN